MIIFLVSFTVLWLSAQVGSFFRTRRKGLDEEERHDFGVVLTATLTLLGLIIGFSFSMAISRYDQRKNFEEGEANAISTEYFRADLLPTPDALKVRALLREYVDMRILYYSTMDEARLHNIAVNRARLQGELWAAVRDPGLAHPTQMTGLAVAGMNDVLNAQGLTQASWWNRIPHEAWGLLGIIAISCNLLIGYSARRSHSRSFVFLVLPILVSIALFLIADIDSPRGGAIRVSPVNLENLIQSLPDLQPPAVQTR